MTAKIAVVVPMPSASVPRPRPRSPAAAPSVEGHTEVLEHAHPPPRLDENGATNDYSRTLIPDS